MQMILMTFYLGISEEFCLTDITRNWNKMEITKKEKSNKHCGQQNDELSADLQKPIPSIKENVELLMDAQWSQIKILKNLILVSFGFLLLFTAYEGMVVLQSTMNDRGGVGVKAEATLYAFYCISSLFFPKYVIRKLGCKRTIILALLGNVPFIASNFYPHWCTLIPSAVLVGLVGPMLWAANCTYVNELSFLYSLRNKDSLESITSRFFGLSGMFFMSSYVWGNLLSYFILMKDQLNASSVQTNGSAFICGTQFCEIKEDNPNLLEPSKHQRYILTYAFLTCSLLAVLLVGLLLDVLPGNREKKEPAVISLNILMSTFRVMKRVNQLLMMPLVFYLGISEGFYFTDFTKAYIACAWSVYHIGYVTICCGVLCAVSSSLSGLLVKYLGRVPIFLAAGAINVVAIVLLVSWTPNSSNPDMFFILAGMWGFFLGVFRSLIMALYGFLFQEDEEAAFGNYYLWNSLGLCGSFAYSNYLCMDTKIYILCVFFCLAMFGYLVLEIKILLEKRTYRINAD